MAEEPRYTSFAAILVAMLLASESAPAQIVTDGSVGRKVSLSGGEIGADLGARRGDNLFHSFEKFGIATCQTATKSGRRGVRPQRPARRAGLVPRQHGARAALRRWGAVFGSGQDR
jgi:hypothetical protein